MLAANNRRDCTPLYEWYVWSCRVRQALSNLGLQMLDYSHLYLDFPYVNHLPTAVTYGLRLSLHLEILSHI